MRSSLRKLLLAALVLVILGALVYRSRGLIHLQGFNWARLGQAIRHTQGSLLLLSVVAIYVCYALRALRWLRFSRYLGPTNFLSIYSSTLMGFAALFLLGRAGEPVRPLLIARRDRLSISSAFGIYTLERIFDAASTMTLAGLGLMIYTRRGVAEGASSALVVRARSTGAVLLVVLMAAVGALIYFRLHGAGAMERRLPAWREAGGWRKKVAGIFTGFSEGLHAIRSFGDLFAALFYSAAHWGLVVAIYLWTAQAFGGRLAELNFSSAMLVLAFTMVGSAIQLPGVGGGAQVASFLAFTGIFGVEQEPAAAASIVLWLITFAASSLAGVPLLIREGWSMGELRRLAREDAAAAEAPEKVRSSSASSGDAAR